MGRTLLAFFLFYFTQVSPPISNSTNVATDIVPVNKVEVTMIVDEQEAQHKAQDLKDRLKEMEMCYIP